MFKLSGFVNGKPAVILFDCGATGNFVSSAFVQQHSFASSALEQPCDVTLADGSKQSAGTVIPSARIVIGSYSDTLDLVSLPLSGYDVILGMSWFHHFNPIIDWKKKEMKFVDDNGTTHMLSQRTSTVRAASR